MKRLLRPIAALGTAAALVAGCMTVTDRPPEAVALPRVPEAVALPRVTGFSENQPGEAMPQGWQNWSLSKFKNPTRYQLVNDAGTTVVRASARASASGLIHYLDIDPRAHPVLTWRWNVTDLPLSEASSDDSPVRIVVSFAGDLDTLSFAERIFYDGFRLLSGQQLPYAALMYIWGTRTPKDSVAPNAYTSRIKMIVVESGRDKLGTWQEVTRNVYEDYKRAFGEAPGAITAVGILTETDENSRDVVAYYGDITFRQTVTK